MNNLSQKNHQKFTLKGVHIFTICDAESAEAKKYENLLEQIRAKRNELIETGKASRELLKALYEDFQSIKKALFWTSLKKQFVIENVTTDAGRSVLAARLGGDVANTGIVNYTALGTDTTAESEADATLGAETYRKALSSGTNADNVAYLETFFTASEVSGTFEEFGMFIDGTGTADSGVLFNRFTATVTKSLTETLNVQSIITINDA